MKWYYQPDTVIPREYYDSIYASAYSKYFPQILKDSIHDWLVVLDWQMRNGEKLD